MTFSTYCAFVMACGLLWLCAARARDGFEQFRRVQKRNKVDHHLRLVELLSFSRKVRDSNRGSFEA